MASAEDEARLAAEIAALEQQLKQVKKKSIIVKRPAPPPAPRPQAAPALRAAAVPNDEYEEIIEESDPQIPAVASPPPPPPPSQSAAEINRRQQEEMERLRLEEEIRQMEAAIQAQQKTKKRPSARQSSSSRTAAPTTASTRPPSESPNASNPTGSVNSSTPQVSKAELDRLMLEEEIKKMEAEIERQRQEVAMKAKSEAKAPKDLPATNSSLSSQPVPAQSVAPRMESAPPPVTSKVASPLNSTPPSQAPAPTRPQGSTSNATTSTTTPNSVQLTPDEENVAAPFRRMQKMGLPEGAILQRLDQEGVSPRVRAAILASPGPTQPSSPPPTSAPTITSIGLAATTPASTASLAKTTLTDDEEIIAAPFRKMQKLGLPEGAILHRMEQEHVSSRIRTAVLGQTSSTAAPAPVPKPVVKSDPIKPAVPQSQYVPQNLFAALSAAADAREERATQGELIMQEFDPEVEAEHQTSPQLSFSMAEMVTKLATDREKRLAAGGEKRMTKIKEKSEYKKEFSNIVIEAASMGRLTRLNEHYVEAVAVEKTPEQEWKSQGLLAIQWRSNYVSIIHQAALAGKASRLPEKVVSNFPEEEQDWEWDETKPMSPRMAQLVELNRRVGEGQHKVDKLVQGRKEEKGADDTLLIHPMVFYNNIEEVKLPKPAPPKIDPNKHKKKLLDMQAEAERQHRPMNDISNIVAERAWERRTRLDRPGGILRMKDHCDCGYCATASPYQTFAYRVLENRIKQQRHRDLEDEKLRMQQQPVRMNPREEARRQSVRDLKMGMSTDSDDETVPASGSPKRKKPATAGDKLKEKLKGKNAIPNFPSLDVADKAVAPPTEAAKMAPAAVPVVKPVPAPAAVPPPAAVQAGGGGCCVIL